MHRTSKYSASDYFLVSDGEEYLKPVRDETNATSGRLRTTGLAFWNNFAGAYYAAISPAVFAKVMAADRYSQGSPGLDRLAQIHAVLSELLHADIFRLSAEHLTRQGLVAAWTSLEVLASDLFVTLVNGDPKLAERIWQDARGQKLYQYSQKSLVAALQESGFDLSDRMGTFLVRQRPIDDVETMRTVFDILFPQSSTLRVLLTDDQLWRLYKSRNLIVHRGAEVDETFRTSTGMDISVGQMLKVAPEQLTAYMTVVGKVGVELLKNAKVLQPSN